MLVALALVLVACSIERPGYSEWRQHWDRVVTYVPTLDDLGVEDPKAVCDEALILVREERVYLVPAPQVTLDDPVHNWLGVADETFFECPPRSGDVHGFERAYQLLDEYAAEVEAAIGN